SPGTNTRTSEERSAPLLFSARRAAQARAGARPRLSDGQTEVNCREPMLLRLRRFLDVKPGEGLPVLLTFLYIAVVVASYLLAKPIRNGLFLKQYGPYS